MLSPVGNYNSTRLLGDLPCVGCVCPGFELSYGMELWGGQCFHQVQAWLLQCWIFVFEETKINPCCGVT